MYSTCHSKSKHKKQLAALKSDCGLFSRLYISCQTRDGDMNNFFSHENQAAPPALSTGGKIRLGVKADLLRCLESDLLEENVNIVCIYSGQHSSNPGSTQTAHQTYLLPGQLLEPGIGMDPEMPEPSDWGWTKEATGWQSLWTTHLNHAVN